MKLKKMDRLSCQKCQTIVLADSNCKLWIAYCTANGNKTRWNQ